MTTKQERIARTPLDQWHSQHGARFVERDGWRLPAEYQGVQAEIHAAKSGVGLVDISAFAKLRLVGASIPAVVQRLSGNAAIRPGKVFSIDENERLIVCCLAADQLLLLGATASISTVKSLNVDQDPSIEQQDVTCGLAGVHLIGPKVDELLRRLVPLDVSASTFPAGSCAETSCAGIHGTIVRGTEFEVPAMRIYVSWDYGEYLWERLIDAGRDLGVTPVGIEAWQALIKTGERPV